ncbi:sensor histidine kinase [Robbsia andropogonis]|nr:ATP-binding protein [Robbsia andropogonis]
MVDIDNTGISGWRHMNGRTGITEPISRHTDAFVVAPAASARQSRASITASLDIFDVLPDAYVILDNHYRVVRVNDQYLATVQESRDTLIGHSIFDVNQWGPHAQRKARAEWLMATFNKLHRTRRPVSAQYFRYDSTAQTTRFPVVDPTLENANNATPYASNEESALVPRYWTIQATLIPALEHTREGKVSPPDTDQSFGTDREPHWIALRVWDVTEEMARTERSQRERAQLRSLAQLRQQLVADANAKLADEKHRLEQAMSFAELGAWEWQPDSGAIICTAQCKINLGLTRDAELTEKILFESVIDPRDRQRMRDAIYHALSARTFFEIDCRTRRPDGSLHWILVRGSGRYTEDGVLEAVLGLMLDITQRKELELAQESQLSEERSARQRSDDRVDTMDGFVSSVSHELRSPLNAILSWTQLLERVHDPEKIRQGIDVIARNARQLSLMVGDLLDTGAIVSGKMSVRRIPLDLGALTGLVAEEMRPDVQARGLDLVTPALQSCVVLGDESRLRQIVWNLLSNAMKFSREGPVEVSVRVEDGMACLRVRDHGVGIDPDALDGIFERFQQLGSTNAGRIGGLGLGLWLVRNLVECHDGTVTAASDGVGHGATFTVRLPIYRA